MRKEECLDSVIRGVFKNSLRRRNTDFKKTTLGQFLWWPSTVYLRKECTCTLRIGKREKAHCYGNKVCSKKSRSKSCLLLNLRNVEVNVVYFWHLKQCIHIAKRAYRTTTTYWHNTVVARWPRRSPWMPRRTQMPKCSTWLQCLHGFNVYMASSHIFSLQVEIYPSKNAKLGQLISNS